MKNLAKFIFVAILLCFSCTHQQLSKIDTLEHNGKIRFYVYYLNEFAEVQYLDNDGKWIPEAYAKINHLFRSRRDNKTHPIDKDLIIVLDHVQDHFKADTIEIISGYRSPEFNKWLQDKGRTNSTDSKHLEGKAVDFHIDEVSEKNVYDYLVSLKVGGVGYYGSDLMVHFQPGKLWSKVRNEYFENTKVGLFNKKSPLKLKTDRFFYHVKDALQLQIGREINKKEKEVLRLEKFHRGKWESAGYPILIDHKLSLNKMAYGKYRFRLDTESHDWQNSNEFYVKK